MRDVHHQKLDAILARISPRRKIDRVLEGVEDLIARFELGPLGTLVRGDDANFKEADHPRDKSGKFTKGNGATAHGIAGYKESLAKATGKAAKASGAGLINWMLMSGKYSKDDIYEAAQQEFGIKAQKAGYVNWYKKDLEKKGFSVPEPPKESTVGSEESDLDAKEAASLEDLKTQEENELQGSQVFQDLKNSVQQSNVYKFFPKAKGPLDDVLDNMLSSPPEIQEKIGAALDVISKLDPLKDYEKSAEALKKVESKDPAAVALNGMIGAIHENVLSGTSPNPYLDPSFKAPEPKAPEPEPKPEPKAPEPPKTLAEQVKDSYVFKNVNVKAHLDPVLQHLDNLTPENKPKVEAKLKELVAMDVNLDGGEKEDEEFAAKVGALQPIAGYGKSVSGVNDAIASLKQTWSKQAAKPAAAATYTPHTPAQQQVFDALSGVPHFDETHIRSYQNKDGVKVKAILHQNTEEIADHGFTKVSSAYGEVVEHKTATSADVSNAMQEYAGHVMAGLTPEEQYAASSYKGSGYTAINDSLLAGGAPHKSVKHIDSAMSKSRLPADTPLWRGMRTTLEKLTGFTDPAKAVGRSFDHVNFVSASRSKKVSEERFGGGKGILLKFIAPAGAPGLVLGGQTGSSELESVLPRNAVFKISRVEPRPGKEPVLHVVYLGTKDQSSMPNTKKDSDDGSDRKSDVDESAFYHPMGEEIGAENLTTPENRKRSAEARRIIYGAGRK